MSSTASRVVVDHDLVEDVVVELEEVRTARRRLEGNEVRDERHPIGIRGLTNAYTSVLSASGSWLMSGASRWLDACGWRASSRQQPRRR